MATKIEERSTYWAVSDGPKENNVPYPDGDHRYYWKIYYEQTDEDKKPWNNRTKVIVEYYIQTYKSASINADVVYYPSGTANSSVNGVSLGSINTSSGSISVGTYYALRHIGTRSRYITHNSVGDASFTWNGSGFGMGTKTSTYKLPHINRYSVVGDVQTFNIDTGVTVPISKYVTSYYNKLEVIAGSEVITTVGDISEDVEIVFTEEELDKIYTVVPTGETTIFTFKLTTYTDSTMATVVGTHTKDVVGNFTIVLPTVNGGVCTDQIVNMSDYTGDETNQTIIQNQSLVRVTIPTSMEAKANTRNATIVEYVVDNIHASYNANGTTIDLSTATKDYVTIYAVDSRGSSSLPYIQKFTKFIDYHFVTVDEKNWSLVRDDNGVSRFVTVEFEGTWWQGNFGVVENTLTPIVYYRVNEGQIWTDLNEFLNGASIGYLDETLIDTSTNGVFKYSGPVMSSDTDKGFDIKNSYDMLIGFQDTFSNRVLTITVQYGEPAVAIYKNKAAMGGPYDESLGGSQLWGDVYLNGELLEHAEEPIVPADHIVEQGDNYIKWNSGKLEQWHYKSVNPVAVTTVTGNVYTAQVALGDWDVPFIEPPKKFMANISWMNTSRYVWVGGPSYIDGAVKNPTETSCGTFNIFSTFSVEVYGSITIHAIGKWK